MLIFNILKGAIEFYIPIKYNYIIKKYQIMFQGIANQITEAQKEIHRQEILMNVADSLVKLHKSELKKRKKAKSALSKLSSGEVDIETLNRVPGLKSFFYMVFGKQENEKDPKRIEFIKDYFIHHSTGVSSEIFENLREKMLPEIKPRKEMSSLERILKKIKSNTQEKYYYPEVSTMMQFLDKSAQIHSRGFDLDRALEIGQEVKEHLSRMIRSLKQENSWGSWDPFFSNKVDSDKIPASAMDEAIGEIPHADAKARAFVVLASPFFDNRDMVLNAKNLDGFLDAFIGNMIYDWVHESKVKTTLSKTNQVFSSINMLLHGLMALKSQNVNEQGMIDVECARRVTRTEAFVKQKMDEKV